MVDNIPFSRAKKSMNRDFADGVMMAELIYHYYPKLVELHNYPPANSLTLKIQNWNMLNNKVLKKLGFHLNRPQIEQLASAVPGFVEELIYELLKRFEKPEQEGSLVENTQSLRQKQYKNGVNSGQ